MLSDDIKKCHVCFDTFHEIKRKKRRVSKLKCGHSFCSRCLKTYVKWSILDPDIDDTSIWGYPKCPMYYCEHRIRNRKFFTKRVWGLMKKQITLKSQLNKRIQYCPRVHCNGTIQKNKQCDQCKIIICQLCQQPKTQRNHICLKDEKLSIAYQEKSLVKCPTCQTKIQKNGGCNDIFCVICDLHFDYSNPSSQILDTESPQILATGNHEI